MQPIMQLSLNWRIGQIGRDGKTIPLLAYWVSNSWRNCISNQSSTKHSTGFKTAQVLLQHKIQHSSMELHPARQLVFLQIEIVLEVDVIFHYFALLQDTGFPFWLEKRAVRELEGKVTVKPFICFNFIELERYGEMKDLLILKSRSFSFLAYHSVFLFSDYVTCCKTLFLINRIYAYGFQ